MCVNGVLRHTLSRVTAGTVLAPFMFPEGGVLARVRRPMLEHSIGDGGDFGGIELLVGASAWVSANGSVFKKGKTRGSYQQHGRAHRGGCVDSRCDVGADAGWPETMEGEVV